LLLQRLNLIYSAISFFAGIITNLKIRGFPAYASLFGATVHWYEGSLGTKYKLYKKELADGLKASGMQPYLITYPESEILGTMAFIDASNRVVGSMYYTWY